jgi:hypothetical protein
MSKLYWPATGLFCVVLAFSGVMHGLRLAPMLESMTALGYPPYFMTILGTAKLLGVVALLVPGRPLLKEWAYAGFAFNLLGATASHIGVGDPVSEIAGPVILFAIATLSYLARPADRRLPGTASFVGRAEA